MAKRIIDDAAFTVIAAAVVDLEVVSTARCGSQWRPISRSHECKSEVGTNLGVAPPAPGSGSSSASPCAGRLPLSSLPLRRPARHG